MAEVLNQSDPIKDVQKFITGKKGWDGAVPEKRRSPWRYNEETGKYDSKPLDPNYFNNYMRVRVECPCCKKMIIRGDIYRHKKRAICIKNKKENP